MNPDQVITYMVPGWWILSCAGAVLGGYLFFVVWNLWDEHKRQR